jgi:hypothetical protein
VYSRRWWRLEGPCSFGLGLGESTLDDVVSLVVLPGVTWTVKIIHRITAREVGRNEFLVVVVLIVVSGCVDGVQWYVVHLVIVYLWGTRRALSAHTVVMVSAAMTTIPFGINPKRVLPCTERTGSPTGAARWSFIDRLGLTLVVVGTKFTGSVRYLTDGLLERFGDILRELR